MDTLQAVEALEAGHFDAFVGVTEGGHLDFKGAPYELASDSGKFELAKDVVAFANSGLDALIVIGIEAKLEEDSPFERATRVRPVPVQSVDTKRYRDTIRERCYPTIQKLEVDAYPAPGDDSRCLFAIRVPPQPESNRPFLVLSNISPKGEKVQGWLVSLPTRALDATEHMRPDQLHETFVRGQSVSVRLDEIVGLLAHLSAPTPELAASDRGSKVASAPAHVPRGGPNRSGESYALVDRARQVAERFAAEPDQQGGTYRAPTLFLAAAPPAPSSVPTLFHESGVRQVLQAPPVTRSEGWNLATLDRAEIVEGSRLRVVNGSRKLVELDEDGALIAVGRFDLLLVIPGPCYADNEYVKVNCLALIEFIHDFVLAAREILEYVEPSPDTVQFAVGLSAAKTPERSLYLPPYALGTLGFDAPYEVPLPDKPDFSWAMSTESPDVGNVAFELVQRVYAYFKRTVEEIPYLSESRDSVDPSTFGRRPE